MIAAKKAHTHKIRKHNYKGGRTPIFFCTLPDCHFKIDVPFMMGKEVLCNRCGEPFIMTSDQLRLVLPHCRKCSKKRVKDEETGISHFIPVSETENPVNDVAADMIDKSSQDMRDRLNAIVKEVPNDEDI